MIVFPNQRRPPHPLDDRLSMPHRQRRGFRLLRIPPQPESRHLVHGLEQLPAVRQLHKVRRPHHIPKQKPRAPIMRWLGRLWPWPSRLSKNIRHALMADAHHMGNRAHVPARPVATVQFNDATADFLRYPHAPGSPLSALTVEPSPMGAAGNSPAAGENPAGCPENFLRRPLKTVELSCFRTRISFFLDSTLGNGPQPWRLMILCAHSSTSFNGASTSAFTLPSLGPGALASNAMRPACLTRPIHR